MKKLIVLCLLILFCSACTKQDNPTEIDIAYKYSGNFVSLVDQRKEPSSKEMKVQYTLQLENLDLDEEVFKTYLSQFGENKEYKHIDITRNTKVYKIDNNERKEVPVTNLEASNHIEVWLKQHPLSDYYLQALEVYILE